jgi:hypothetical protein
MPVHHQGNFIMNQPERPTETPQAEESMIPVLENDAFTDEDQPRYFPVSEGKLMTLYILSFGLYGVYWFYKNWKLQEPMMDKKIYPVWRAIFSIFFTHALFRRIDQSASHLDKQHKFNANALATFFVAAIVISNILENLSGNSSILLNISGNSIIIFSLILFLASTYPILKVQATVNRINNDMLGYLNHKYSLWNYVLIMLGTLLWIMIALGLLAESMGFVAPA